MEVIAIPKKLKKTLRGAAQNLGISPKDLMTHAVLYYLASIRGKMDLREELRMWDEASAADLGTFERSLA